MVWTEGTIDPSEPGYEEAHTFFTKNSIMTAPYQIKSKPNGKRLRSDVDSTHSPFAVGCGYAAHTNTITGSQLLIVRLSDGVSWEIKGKGVPAPTTERWEWLPLVGLTCDEVFFGALGPPTELGVPRGTILKVKLKSLGPGMPPD